MLPLLTIATFLPIAAGLGLMGLCHAPARTAHAVSIAATGITFLLTLWIWSRGIVPGGFAQVEEIAWIPAIGAAYRLGLDGLSLPLVLLTSLLFLVSAVYSARITERARAYVVLLLMLETASLGTFLALDGLLFYVFFEVSLVGMYFLIAGWGYEDRQRAALMFFLYTLLGSLPLLLALIGFFLGSGTFDMRAWTATPPLAGVAAMLALVAMLFTFAVKTPSFPVHTWLPAARAGPDGRQRHPGRRDAEVRHLRDCPLRLPDDAGGLRQGRRRDPRLRGGERAVGRLRRPGADRPEEDGRLHLGQPHGLRGDRRRRGRPGG
jgi:NADH-quinone oxidoreductase subunit M